jgi:hypothetical protein
MTIEKTPFRSRGIISSEISEMKGLEFRVWIWISAETEKGVFGIAEPCMLDLPTVLLCDRTLTQRYQAKLFSNAPQILSF